MDEINLDDIQIGVNEAPIKIPFEKEDNHDFLELKNEVEIIKADIGRVKQYNFNVLRKLREDIMQYVIELNKIESVWDSKEFRRKEEEFENQVKMLENKGDVYNAYLKTKNQISRYKEDLISVRMFLNRITYGFNKISKELEALEGQF